MANYTGYKTVRSRILAYAQDIGWTYVTRAEAGRRRGFDPDGATSEDSVPPVLLCALSIWLADETTTWVSLAGIILGLIVFPLTARRHARAPRE